MGNGIGPHFPGFLVPFPRTRFSIGLPPLWLRLIEARHGVEERKGERTGATPPFFGVSPCPHPLFISHVCVRTRSPPVGVAPLSFIPAGRLGLGPDNRKRSQMKSPHIASVVGRRKPVDRAGDVGRNRGSSSTVRTVEIGADRRETHQCSPTQAQDAAAHFDGQLTHHH